MSNRHMKLLGGMWMGVGLVLGAGCGAGPEEPAASGEVVRAATTEQGLSTIAPKQDPQLCSLPSGRYVVSAQVTNTPDVYNVTFHNDGVEATPLSASCQTMKFVFTEGIPYPSLPPQPPPESDYPKVLFEGWWENGLTPKRLAVKAIWYTEDNLGVITQISGQVARGYFVAPMDLGIPDGWRFNWAGAGSDGKRTQYFYSFWLYADRKLAITDAASSAVYQRLYCQSGTTRLLNGNASNCPNPYSN